MNSTGMVLAGTRPAAVPWRHPATDGTPATDGSPAPASCPADGEAWVAPPPVEAFVLHAADAATLAATAGRIADLAPGLSDAELHDLACQLGRQASPPGGYRIGLVASEQQQLADLAGQAARLLPALKPGQLVTGPGLFVGYDVRGRVVLLFPGLGTGQDPAGSRATSPPPPLFGLTDPEAVQPAVLHASLSGLRWLDRLGVTATAAVGHSLGEISALVWAGCLTEADATRLVAQRSAVIRANGTRPTAMVSLATDAATARALCIGTKLVVAAYNGPGSHVLAGPVGSVRDATRRAERLGIRAVVLDVSHAFHSPAMAGCVAPLRAVLSDIAFAPARRRVVSTVTGREILPGDDVARLLCAELTTAVRFTEALAAVTADADLLCETGPGRALTTLAGAGCDVPAVSLEARTGDDHGPAQAAAALFAAGAVDSLEPMLAGRPARPVDIWQERITLSPAATTPTPATSPAITTSHATRISHATSLATATVGSVTRAAGTGRTRSRADEPALTTMPTANTATASTPPAQATATTPPAQATATTPPAQATATTPPAQATATTPPADAGAGHGTAPADARATATDAAQPNGAAPADQGHTATLAAQPNGAVAPAEARHTATVAEQPGSTSARDAGAGAQRPNGAGAADVIPIVKLVPGQGARPGRFLQDIRLHRPGLELVADTRLAAGTDPYLADYRIDGQSVLPAVLGLEAMAQAASALAGRPLRRAVRLSFDAPVRIPPGPDQELLVRVCVKREGKRVSAVLRSRAGEQWVDHARASFPLRAAESAPVRPAAEPAGPGRTPAAAKTADGTRTAAAAQPPDETGTAATKPPDETRTAATKTPTAADGTRTVTAAQAPDATRTVTAAQAPDATRTAATKPPDETRTAATKTPTAADGTRTVTAAQAPDATRTAATKTPGAADGTRTVAADTPSGTGPAAAPKGPGAANGNGAAAGHGGPVGPDWRPFGRTTAILDSADLYGSICFQTGRFRRVAFLPELTSRRCRALVRGGDGQPWFGGQAGTPDAPLLLGSPGLNDATLHVLQACFPHRRMLPAGCDAVTVSGRLVSGAVEVRAWQRAATRAGSGAHGPGGPHAAGEYLWDVTAVDAAGEAVITWTGLRLRDAGPVPGRPALPPALLGVYLERGATALGLDPSLRISVRCEQPQIGPAAGAVWSPAVATQAKRPGWVSARSRGQLDELSLRLRGASPAACAWETADLEQDGSQRPDAEDPEFEALGRRLRDSLSEPTPTVRARIRTAIECLSKAGRPVGRELVVDGCYDNGWALLHAGDALIACTSVRVIGISSPVAVSIMTGTGMHAAGAA